MKDQGKTVQKTASLHEKAVQAVARGDVPTKPRTRRRSAPVATQGPSTEVTEAQFPKDALKDIKAFIAKKDNSYSYYEILDAQTAVIR